MEGSYRIITTTHKCVGCGIQFTYTHKQTGRPRIFCDECRIKALHRSYLNYRRSEKGRTTQRNYMFHPDGARRRNLRKHVLKRRGVGAENYLKHRARIDAGEAICAKCGAPAKEVDHIIPVALGGTDAEENLQDLCFGCHDVKDAMDRINIREAKHATK